MNRSEPSATVGHVRGAILMAAFSAAWFLWATLVAPLRPIHLLLVPLVLASGVAVVIARRTLSATRSQWPGAASGNPFKVRAYRIAVLFEAIGVPAVFALLSRRPDAAAYVPSLVAIIVGLHFLGLVVAFRSRLYFWVAVAMCACGVVALGAAASTADRTMIVGLGCGAILWVTAMGRLLTVRQVLSGARARADGRIAASIDRRTMAPPR